MSNWVVKRWGGDISTPHHTIKEALEWVAAEFPDSTVKELLDDGYEIARYEEA